MLQNNFLKLMSLKDHQNFKKQKLKKKFLGTLFLKPTFFIFFK